MDQDDNKSKNNLKAVAVGFFLIILAALAIFLKPHFFPDKSNNSGNSAVNENQDLKNLTGLNSTDLLSRMNSQVPPLVLDIRDGENFKKEHLIGSKNISPDNLESTLVSLDKDASYIIVDDLGLTPIEIQVMKQFQVDGFVNVSYLEGGLSQWKNQLNPTVTIGDPYSFTDQSKVTYLKSDDLKNTLAQEASLYIIDLRKSGQFNAGHIAGAVNIFLDDLESRYKEIPLGKKIIVYDNDGLWAFQGAVRLFDLGVTNVYALSDGLDAWKKKGFEVVK